MSYGVSKRATIISPEYWVLVLPVWIQVPETIQNWNELVMKLYKTQSNIHKYKVPAWKVTSRFQEWLLDTLYFSPGDGNGFDFRNFAFF
jgi:hypothetical protein